jgi:hypothetical protein
VLYFELFADRIGSEMDTYFVVKNSGNMGNVIEEQDDSSETLYPNSFFTKTGDPGQAKFTAPADGQYLVFVGSREANTTFGPRALYRLSISRPAPDFRVVVMPKSRDTPMSALALQQGEVAYDVFVERRNGFTEPLTITAEKLPTGVKAAPAFIGTGSNWGTLILTCEPNAPVYNGPINIVCTATIAGKAVTRVARPATITWGVQPGQNIPTLTRLDQQLMLAVRADKSTLRLQADLAGIKHKTKDKDNKDVEVSATFPLYAKPGDKILIPVKALWQAADPRPNPINVQMEPLQSNMQQAAIGTQGNNPLALAKDKNDGVITVDVRATAAAGRYPIVLKGETTVDYLRDPNDKNKKSKANVIGYTTPLEVIVIPNTLGKVSVVAPGSIKAGTTAELTVKVDRAGGYEGDFKIRFTLPKEGTTPRPVTLPDAVIPAGKDEVKITIAVPADTKPGNVQNVVATAVGTVHEKFPISQEAKFSLTIAAAK